LYDDGKIQPSCLLSPPGCHISLWRRSRRRMMMTKRGILLRVGVCEVGMRLLEGGIQGKM
jgi:hypothetical protein